MVLLMRLLPDRFVLVGRTRCTSRRVTEPCGSL
jgi:hypothetical protein